ncbi:MAG: DUF4412 domain-containing protein [Crocinitomicaceae bacterium]|nr:DUF4412 domain-containing protein [Crocinitomicaceae bacterium]MDG1775859.1 DUF4412 domain-containing protein [Crocinitomicaceae bacterium]
MKKILLSALLTICSITLTIAQLNEGHVKFEIEVSATNPEMEMAVGMMQGSTMNLFFADQDLHSELNMGTMMTVSTIVLGKSGDVMILMNGMMGKKAIPTTLDEVLENTKSKEVSPMDVELLDETKDIAGYSCKKAILTNEDGDEMVTWYTADIKVNTQGQSYHNENVPGFPLQFTQNANGLIMTITAIEIEESISKKDKKELFSSKVPDGYTEMSPEALNKMGM